MNPGNSAENPKSLEIKVYNGNGSYTLYEDDEKGVAAYTDIKTTEEDGVSRVKFSTRGNIDVLPEKRDITLSFENIIVNTAIDLDIGLTEKPFAKITVLKNGKEIDARVSKYNIVTVTVENIDYSAEYECIVEYYQLPDLCSAKRAVLTKMLEVEGPLSIRSAVQKEVKNANSIEALHGVITLSDLSLIEKTRLQELF